MLALALWSGLGIYRGASTHRIARLPALVLKSIVVNKSLPHGKPVDICFFIIMLANSQESFAVLNCKAWLVKKGSVVYNFLAIWLVYGVSTVVWTLIYHGASTNQTATNCRVVVKLSMLPCAWRELTWRRFPEGRTWRDACCRSGSPGRPYTRRSSRRCPPGPSRTPRPSASSPSGWSPRTQNTCSAEEKQTNKQAKTNKQTNSQTNRLLHYTNRAQFFVGSVTSRWLGKVRLRSFPTKAGPDRAAEIEPRFFEARLETRIKPEVSCRLISECGADSLPKRPQWLDLDERPCFVFVQNHALCSLKIRDEETW